MEQSRSSVVSVKISDKLRNIFRKSLSLEASSSITCKGLSYSIKRGKKEQKPLLNGVDAIFRPGRLTAIMGASGAGKTTLLTYLAGELSRGHQEGEVAVNGYSASPKDLKRVSVYVFQDDIILQTMTVREAITMSALLRLPRSVSKREREERIDAIIQVMRLTNCQNTKIGSPEQKGISGGERKRTSMAMDLVINPTVLMLDEPTSGLDTFTAYNVMTTLADLAHEQNRTVVATIHQPSSEIFHLLDDLLLLSSGKVAYYGPAKNTIEYFARLGIECPVYTNPADHFFMEILNETFTKEEESEDADEEVVKKRLQRVLNFWEQSEERSKILTEIDALKDAGSAKRFAMATCSRAQAAFLAQFSYLATRAGRNLFRNIMITHVRLIQSLIVGLILGSVYYDIRSKDAVTQGTNRLSALYFYSINQFISSAIGVVTIFVNEKHVFMREYTKGYYSLPAYFLSKTLIELPHLLTMPLVVICCSYWLVGFRSGALYFFRAALLLMLVTLNGVALGTFCGAIFNDITTGMATLSMVLLPCIIFSGIMVNTNDVPIFFKWIPYIAPTRHCFVGLLRNELEDYVFPNCEYSLSNGGIFDCTGNSAMKFNDLDQTFSIRTSMGILIASYLVLTLLAYLALFRLTRKRN